MNICVIFYCNCDKNQLTKFGLEMTFFLRGGDGTNHPSWLLKSFYQFSTVHLVCHCISNWKIIESCRYEWIKHNGESDRYKFPPE